MVLISEIESKLSLMGNERKIRDTILFSNTKHVIDIILNNNIITYIKVEYPKSLGFDGFQNT